MVVVDIVINEKIRKRHYLRQVDNFFLDWEFDSSYSGKTAYKLKETIIELLLESNSYLKKRELDIEGISYLIQVEKKEVSNGGDNYQKLPLELQKEMDTRKLKSLVIYNMEIY
ncbi:hypothetical protein [Caldisericum sp.]|uniref:hypothetical protein n=1 Tax=Caldisericum sp. TaxID=2499687 RepID=UPI003D0ACE81